MAVTSLLMVCSGRLFPECQRVLTQTTALAGGKSHAENAAGMERVNMPGILALQRTDTSGDQTEGII